MHLFAVLGTAGIVIGQATNATCVSNSTTSFLFNSVSESPWSVCLCPHIYSELQWCPGGLMEGSSSLVWSKVQSLCLLSTSYINVPPLLDTSWSYNPPSSSGSICQCNVISYALMAGCTWSVAVPSPAHASMIEPRLKVSAWQYQQLAEREYLERQLPELRLHRVGATLGIGLNIS